MTNKINLKGVILIEPKKHVNVGSVARSMKSFGFEKLIIVNKLDHLRLDKAGHISKQGVDVVENVEIVEHLSEIIGHKVAAISRFDNEKYGFKLSEINEFEFPEEFYLVMGRESNGLTYEEMLECDSYLTIDTEGKYGILNLAQATTIILYEIYRRKKSS